MTNTDPQLCTSAPTTGFKIHVMARMIATKFNSMEKDKLNLILFIIFPDSANK